jgi:hypothetical protein
MLRVGVATVVCWVTFLAAAGGALDNSARAQGATVQIRPADAAAIVSGVLYPDAVICNVTSTDSVEYKIVFYKSQTISFAHEPNNVAEYGTTFVRDPDKFEASTPYKWWLQLGQPGNITMFTLPSGWTTGNCAVGKSIAELIADKQALKIFTPQ